MKKYDVIVLGVGGMGSAACFHAARRGLRTLGIERFQVGHDHGSSHGETRMIRKAYFEHPNYVPLLQRAYFLWKHLEDESATELLVKTGLIIFGDAETSLIFRGVLASAKAYRLPIERLSLATAAKRFPYYRAPENFSAVFEPEAGFLHVERACRAHADMARRFDAEIREGEAVLRYAGNGDGVEVVSDQGTYFADRLIVAGGAWSATLLSELGLKLKLYRLIQYWFRSEADHDVRAGVPCFGFHLNGEFYYGFPMLDGKTIKIAAHFAKTPIASPADKNIARVPDEELIALRNFIQRCLPKVSSELDCFVPCMYTMTDDENFVIDRHPRNPNVVFAAGFSGHGFKFSSVVGETLVDLAVDGKTAQPIDFLRLRDGVLNQPQA